MNIYIPKKTFSILRNRDFDSCQVIVVQDSELDIPFILPMEILSLTPQSAVIQLQLLSL